MVKGIKRELLGQGRRKYGDEYRYWATGWLDSQEGSDSLWSRHRERLVLVEGEN